MQYMKGKLCITNTIDASLHDDARLGCHAHDTAHALLSIDCMQCDRSCFETRLQMLKPDGNNAQNAQPSHYACQAGSLPDCNSQTYLRA